AADHGDQLRGGKVGIREVERVERVAHHGGQVSAHALGHGTEHWPGARCYDELDHDDRFRSARIIDGHDRLDQRLEGVQCRVAAQTAKALDPALSESASAPVTRFFRCCGQQVVVPVEVVPHRANVQPRLVGDLPQRHSLDAVCDDEAERGLDDLLTPLFGVDPCGHDSVPFSHYAGL